MRFYFDLEVLYGDPLQCGFETLPDFLASHKEPCVVSAVPMAVQIRQVGFGPDRAMGLFHGYTAENRKP